MHTVRRLIPVLWAALAALALPSRANAFPCPNVLLVLDRSGSMDEDPNGGSKNPSKWEILQQAVGAILDTYGDQLPFGLEMFTSDAFDDQQCFADTMISVDPAHDTAQKIRDAVNRAKPDASTNTGEAIRRARESMALQDGNRGQYIILITDGDPNCNSNEPAYSISEIKRALGQNPPINTFVIGFDGSGGVKPDVLNQMAQAGGQPQEGCNGKDKPCYYSASDAKKLSESLAKILVVVSGGEFGQMTCDDTCLAVGCSPGQMCSVDEQNGPHCVPDPCHGMICPGNQYCRAGQCLAVCPECATGQVCKAGQCVADPCAGKACGAGQACDPVSGTCIANVCANKTCRLGTSCQLPSGTCLEDPCSAINCPAGTECKPGGYCQQQGGPPGTGPTATRPASGCAVATQRQPASRWPLFLVSLAAVGVAFSRRRRAP